MGESRHPSGRSAGKRPGGLSEAARAHTREMPRGAGVPQGGAAASQGGAPAPVGAPVSAGEAPVRVDDAAASRMTDKASGVSSLRRARTEEPGRLSPARRRALAAGIAVAAVAVAVCAFLLFRSVLGSLGQAGDQAPAASSATDAYVVLAVTDDAGGLSRAYVAYVDSIGGRTELCALDAATSTQVAGQTAGVSDGQGGAATLAQVWSDRGLSGLCSALADMGGVQVAGGAALQSSQMERLLALAGGEQSQGDASQLASQLASQSQGDSALGEAALRGMLSTMAQVGSDGLALLEAPATDSVTSGGANVKVLTADAWITMLKGMKDTWGDVSS